MLEKITLTLKDKTIYILCFNRLTEDYFKDCLKKMTKSSISTERQEIFLILFNTTTIKEFKEKVITRLEHEKNNSPNNIIITIHKNLAQKKKKNPPLIELLLLLDEKKPMVNNSQDLIDLAKNIKELIDL